jgi:hypothetical protein
LAISWLIKKRNVGLGDHSAEILRETLETKGEKAAHNDEEKIFGWGTSK